MTMVLLVMLFLLELQQDWKSKASLLILRDVKEILEATLPKRQFSPAEVLLHIEQKNLSQGFSKAFSSSKTTGGNALIPFILHGSHSRSRLCKDRFCDVSLLTINCIITMYEIRTSGVKV